MNHLLVECAGIPPFQPPNFEMVDLVVDFRLYDIGVTTIVARS
jgi:hypothetical protein